MKYRCETCGYVHIGDPPPEICPVCGAGKEKFKPLDAPPPQAQPRHKDEGEKAL